jgi:hypothetical protein
MATRILPRRPRLYECARGVGHCVVGSEGYLLPKMTCIRVQVVNMELSFAARKLGVPIYELLGGKVRNKLKVYAWIGGDRPADIEAQA